MILLAATAFAESPFQVRVNGDLKSFFTATFPYEHTLMPDHPTGSAVVDGRLKLEIAYAERLKLQVHHTTTLLTAPSSGLGPSTGVGLQAPEVIDLSWTAFDDDLVLRGRLDRAWINWTPDGMGITLGRQPISFGNANVFTPLDLVNPFNPSVIDQEYKPGVDALRIDLYQGFATKLTLAAAYAGSWDAEGMIVAAYGQSTIGVTDIGLFAGSVRGDAVFGTSVVTSIGAIGLTTDLSFTAPSTGDPYVRGTLGALWRPTNTTTLSGEFYVQTLGATQPDELLETSLLPAFQRNEIWLMGVAYGSLAFSQELTPTLVFNTAVIANVLDPSAFIAPSLSWSAAGNVDVIGGGFIGVGKRPRELTLNDLERQLAGEPVLDYLGSEFGTYPATGYLQVRTYF